MKAEEVMNNGKLLNEHWYEYVDEDEDEVLYINLVRLYSYKDRRFAISYAYQNVLKKDYELIVQSIEELYK